MAKTVDKKGDTDDAPQEPEIQEAPKKATCLRLRLKAAHQDKIQFDPETGITWTGSKVKESPITEFVRTRLGKTLEEVDDTPVTV